LGKNRETSLASSSSQFQKKEKIFIQENEQIPPKREFEENENKEAEADDKDTDYKTLFLQAKRQNAMLEEELKQKEEKIHLIEGEVIEKRKKEKESEFFSRDLEAKYLKAINDNKILVEEIDTLRAQINDTKRRSDEKEKAFVEQIGKYEKDLIELEKNSHLNAEKLLQEHDHRCQDLLADSEAKLQSMQQRIEKLENGNAEQSSEIKKMGASEAKLIYQHNEEMRELENRIREEESKKYENYLKVIDTQLKGNVVEREN